MSFRDLVADELKEVAFVEFEILLALSCWVLLAFRDELVADKLSNVAFFILTLKEFVAVTTTIETEYPMQRGVSILLHV